jgi:parallel beta-helix repeat protein
MIARDDLALGRLIHGQNMSMTHNRFNSLFWLMGMILMTFSHSLAAAGTDTIELSPVAGDNAPAITAALNTLNQRGGGTLVLKKGDYPLRAGPPIPEAPNYRLCVIAHELKNITIDGSGAKLICLDNVGIFGFSNGSNITIKNLSIDYDPPPFSSGKIVRIKADEQAFDIEPTPGNAPIDGRIVQAILAYDAQKQRLSKGGWEVYQSQGERDNDPIKRQPDGTFRVFQKRGTSLPQVGWHVVLRHQVYGRNAISFMDCKDVTLQDVLINTSPGMGLYAGRCTNVTLNGFSVKPLGDRWMSTTADATHFLACRGTVTIANSEFRSMGDDAVNIHGRYGLVTERIDDRTLAVANGRMHPYYDKERNPWEQPQTGDVLEFGSPQQPLLAIGTLTVASAITDPARKRTIVTLTQPLPREVVADCVLANVSATPVVRITSSAVQRNRARGFLLQSRDVKVSNCKFEDVTGPGIQVCADTDEWWESLGSRDVEITDCAFTRCNFGVARRTAALEIFASLKNNHPAGPGAHQRLRIAGNTFTDNAGHAIALSSSSDVTIENNRVTGGDKTAIRVISSTNVRIIKNDSIDAPRAIRVDKPAAVAANSPDSVTVTDNHNLTRND